MPLVKNAATTLSQGVSQQAESQRYPSQAAEQINAYSSHIKGLVKRPPTNHISPVGVNAATGTQSFLHLMNRDANEQYAIVINKGVEVQITGVDTTSSRTWAVGEDTVTGSLKYTNAAEEDVFSVDDPVQFQDVAVGDRLPAGIKRGVTYYVHGVGDGGLGYEDKRWFTLKATKEASSSTNAITLGEVWLTRQQLGASNDEYKAGLLIESIRHANGTWTDGIITIRFSSPTSGSGHTLSNGKLISIQGLRGTSKYVLDPNELLELSQISKTQGASGRSLVDNETAYKFWLKVPDGIQGAAEHYGYRTDGRQLLTTYGDKYEPLLGVEDGGTLETGGRKISDWIGFHDSQTTFTVNDNVLTKVTGDLDTSTVPLGLLIKLGDNPKNPRGIVVARDSTTITVAEDLDFTNGADSSSATLRLKYWASPQAVGDKFRYFAQTNYLSADAATPFAIIGDNGGTCKATGGDKGVGPYVFDLNTGEQYPVESNTKLGDPLNYLLDVPNPATDIKAKSIGDSTFLLNKYKEVQELPHTPHDPQYEAFVTVNTADYGKYYKIKVGSAAVNAVSPEADGTPVGKASTLLYGNSSADGTEVLSRPVCMIRAVNNGGLNNTRVRLLQNYCYGFATSNTGGVTGMTFPDFSSDHQDVFAGENNDGKNIITSKQELRRTNSLLSLDSSGNIEGDQRIIQNYDNKFVSIHYNPNTSELFIWVNFYWATKTVFGNTTTAFSANELTTVGHLKSSFEQEGLAGLNLDWEIVYCDENGIAADDSPTGTVSDESYYFYDSELFGVKVSGSYVTPKGEVRPLGKDYATTYKRGNEVYDVGKDYIVRSFGNTPADLGDIHGSMRQYIRLGLQTPSTPMGEYSRLPQRGRALTAGGAGTAEQTSIKDNGSMKVYDGEYFYRTPKWTGSTTQKAIGTERIAEVLASNALIIDGDYEVSASATGKLRRADGRTLTADQTVYLDTGDNPPKEEAIGLTFTRDDLDATATGDDRSIDEGWLVNKGNFKKHLQRISDGEPLENMEWTVEQVGNVIAIRNNLRIPFDITVTDDLGGNGLALTYFEVDEAAKLPPICRHGTVVRVVGNAREEADDYYLKFYADKADSSRLMHGRWEECVGFGTTVAFDPATMPVVLQRRWNKDGTRKFVLQHYNWNERGAGDDGTNPMPAFVFSKLSDIFLFKNRLGFISGESVVLSEVGEYFNFFRTTVAALLDSAPISVLAASEKVSKLHTALTYAERLILFSQSQQFSLSGNQYLSPKTVSVTPTTDFINSPDARPILAGSSVFFAFGRTGFSGVSEYFLSKEQLDSMDAQDVTAHIPKYITGSIKKMASCSSEDVMAVLTDTAGSAKLYIYKYFLDTNKQRIQSAWFTYTTGDSFAQILNIEFIGNKLYLVIKRGSAVYLEYLTFEDSQTESNMDYDVRLDRKVAKSDVTIASSTTLTLPYTVTANTRLVTTGSVALASTTTGTTTFTVSGYDLSDTEASNYISDFYVGELYEMAYTFTQPFLKTEKTIEGGRYQLQRARLEYANARTFTVEVTHHPTKPAPTQATNTSTFATDLDAIIGTADLQDGFYTFPIQERNDQLKLVIKNNTIYPSDFLSIDYEARAFSYGTRWKG